MAAKTGAGVLRVIKPKASPENKSHRGNKHTLAEYCPCRKRQQSASGRAARTRMSQVHAANQLTLKKEEQHYEFSHTPPLHN
jgi:hypothetical protein